MVSEVVVTYLYGDQTPSPLQTNFLAWLGDAMEFCIHLVLAEQRIESLRADGRALTDHADQERVRITGLRALVLEAADAANRLGGESMSELAATRVKAAAQDAIAATLAQLQEKLDADRAGLAARDRAERDGCLDALARWVAPHETHEGTWALGARLDESGGYAAETRGSTPFGLKWHCAIELSVDHPMRKPMRVGELVPRIDLVMPEPNRWHKRGVKLVPQRIDDFSIDEFATAGPVAGFSLRTAPRAPTGLDVEIRNEQVDVTLVGAREAHVIEVSAYDTQRLLTLRDRTRELVRSHAGVKRRVLSATLDDALFADQPDFVAVAKRMIDFAAPIVKEIRNHSLSPNELVIRRPLLNEDTRRSWEEIFIPTSLLLDKMGRLPRNLRTLFAPLGLDPQRAHTPLPFEVVDLQPVAEVRRVEPSVIEMEAEPHELAPTSGSVSSTATPSSVPTAQSLGSIVIDQQLMSEAPRTASTASTASTATASQIEIDASSKEALAATVKRIIRSAREGRTSEAYKAYATLFEDDSFAKHRSQDQRQVLKLMVLAKSAPPSSNEVTSAYESALARLKRLAAETDDPLDHEMIGACEERLHSSAERSSR
ncbi:MAG TPA: hypothetical protein VIV40_18495 [Kofleriaceae bacterium]